MERRGKYTSQQGETCESSTVCGVNHGGWMHKLSARSKLFLLSILAGLLIAPAPSISLTTDTGASVALSLQVYARPAKVGASLPGSPIAPDAALYSGDGIQVRVRPSQDAYVYVVIYGSTYSASLLYPGGAANEAFIRAGEERIIPGPGAFFPLDHNTGGETIFGFATHAPLDEVSSMLARMEAYAGDLASVAGVIGSRFETFSSVGFRHLPPSARPVESVVRAPETVSVVQPQVQVLEPVSVAAPEEQVPEPVSVAAPEEQVSEPVSVAAPEEQVPEPVSVAEPEVQVLAPAQASAEADQPERVDATRDSGSSGVLEPESAIEPTQPLVSDTQMLDLGDDAQAPASGSLPLEPGADNQRQSGDGTVLGGAGSRIEWLLSGGNPDEMPGDDGDVFFAEAENLDAGQDASASYQTPGSLPADEADTETQETQNVSLGQRLKGLFGFGASADEEATVAAPDVQDQVRAGSPDTAQAIPLVESGTAAGTASSDVPEAPASQASLSLSDTAQVTDPDATAGGGSQALETQPAGETSSDPQIEGLSDALSLGIGLEETASDGEDATPDPGQGGDDGGLLSTVSSWFSGGQAPDEPGDVTGEQEVAAGQEPLFDPEPPVTVLSAEGDLIAGLDEASAEPVTQPSEAEAEVESPGAVLSGEGTLIAGLDEAPQASTAMPAAQPSEQEVAGEAATKPSSGLAKLFGGLFSGASATEDAGEERVEAPQEVPQEAAEMPVTEPDGISEQSTLVAEGADAQEGVTAEAQDESSRTLWGTLGSLLPGNRKQPAETHVILQGSGASPGQVVGQTARISSSEEAGIRKNAGAGVTITGAQSQDGKVSLKGTRERVVGESEVLSGQGKAISALLGEEPQEAVPDETSEAAAPIPQSDDTELVVTASAPQPALSAVGAESAANALASVDLSTYESTAEINVSASDDVSSSVVLVVTAAGTGSGTIIDDEGHVLANWHVIKDFPRVSVLLKSDSSDTPSVEQVYVANVVKLNKFSDLALLQIVDPPAGLRPVRVGSDAALKRGQIVHAIGHPRGAAWVHTVATVTRIKPGGSWTSGYGVAHRATLIKAQVQEDPGASGAPIFNRKLELIGISAAAGRRPGQLNVLSVESILEFLGVDSSHVTLASHG